MPVETAIYIHDLNPADPVSTDGIKQGDDHIRLVKTVIQNTLPNATAPYTGTPDQLNRAATAHATAGTAVIEPTGTQVGGQVRLDPVPGSGSVTLWNSGNAGADGGFAVTVNDRTNANPTIAMSLTKAGALIAAASVNAPVILQNGAPLVPRGVIWMWSGATNAVPVGFALCNGLNGTPDLRNMFIVGAGGSYAVGQTGGAASQATITDAQGTHAHTGITASNGPWAMVASTDVQGAHAHTGAVGSTALSVDQLPPHNHTITVGGGSGGLTGPINGVATIQGPIATSNTGSGAGHSHGIVPDGSHAHNVSVSNVPAHQHGIVNDGNHAHNVTVNTVPPFYALALIMKL